MEWRIPKPFEVAAVIGGLGMVGQFFGLTAPAVERADANRDANYSCRDALLVAEARVDDYLEHMETEH